MYIIIYTNKKISRFARDFWLETVDKIRTECRDELLEMKDAMKAIIEKI